MPDAEAGLLLRLGSDALLGSGVVEQAGRGFDQEIVAAVDVRGIAELPDQHHGPAVEVVEQDRGAIAPVVGLAALPLPGPVAPPPAEGRLLQHVPIVGQHLDGLDADPVGQRGGGRFRRTGRGVRVGGHHEVSSTSAE